jgi:hypothetical protein
LRHHDFLDLSGKDQTRAFAETLIATLRSLGTIFVYNQAFEGGVLRRLAARYSDLASPLLALVDCMVDLLPLTREHYYHPAMKGSWSIKAVLPTIAQTSSMPISLRSRTVGPPRRPTGRRSTGRHFRHAKNSLDQAPQRYCGRDTEALVRLAAFLARCWVGSD